MYKGKKKCKILKQIRAEIAKNNDIDYVIEECKHKGDCTGTCPKCEAEVRELERQLALRASAGKRVLLAGVAAGIVLSTTACGSDIPTPGTTTGTTAGSDPVAATDDRQTPGEVLTTNEDETTFEIKLPDSNAVMPMGVIAYDRDAKETTEKNDPPAETDGQTPDKAPATDEDDQPGIVGGTDLLLITSEKPVALAEVRALFKDFDAEEIADIYQVWYDRNKDLPSGQTLAASYKELIGTAFAVKLADRSEESVAAVLAMLEGVPFLSCAQQNFEFSPADGDLMGFIDKVIT